MRSSAYGAPVDLVAAGDDGHLAVVLGGQRDAGVGRDRADRGDAGDDLEADAGLDAGLRLLGTGGVEERVAGHQAHHALLLAVAYDDLGAGRVGQRLAVLAEAAVDDLRAVLGPRRRPRTERTRSSVLGRLGDDDLGALRGAPRRAPSAGPGSPGPLPTNDTQPWWPAGRRRAGLRGLCSRHACCVPHWWCVHQVCCSVVEHVAREAVCRAARPRSTGPVALIRTDRPPSSERATAREPQLLAVLALDDLGQRTQRGGATGLEGGEHGALGGDRGAGGGVVEPASAATRSVSSVRHSIASAPCPGAGSIWSGSSTSVTSSRRPRRARPARARTHGVVLDRSRTLRMRVSTLPRMPTISRPRPSASSWADPARRAGAEAAADGQLAEGEPVAGDDDVARVLAGGYGGERDAVGGRGREVLQRVDGDVDLAGEQGVAQRADEDAGAADAWPAGRCCGRPRW